MINATTNERAHADVHPTWCEKRRHCAMGADGSGYHIGNVSTVDNGGQQVEIAFAQFDEHGELGSLEIRLRAVEPFVDSFTDVFFPIAAAHELGAELVRLADDARSERSSALGRLSA